MLKKELLPPREQAPHVIITVGSYMDDLMVDYIGYSRYGSDPNEHCGSIDRVPYWETPWGRRTLVRMVTDMSGMGGFFQFDKAPGGDMEISVTINNVTQNFPYRAGGWSAGADVPASEWDFDYSGIGKRKAVTFDPPPTGYL